MSEKDNVNNNNGSLVRTGKIKIGGHAKGSLADRMAQAKLINNSSETHTIQLLLDCSGSMGEEVLDDKGKSIGSRMQLLREAAFELVKTTDLQKFPIGIITFPNVISAPPVGSLTLLKITITGLHENGSTPMGTAIHSLFSQYPNTERAILVSDGEATDDPVKTIDDFINVGSEEKKKKPIKIDCVHIGDSSSGEETLKEIAKRTGGIYMKFVDLVKFREAFKYLAPRYYGLLCAGKIETGANEVAK